MQVLDRYLLREIAAPFAAGMGLFFAVVAFTQVVRLSDAVTGLGMQSSELLAAFAFSLPPLLGFLIPVSCLFATLLAIGRLAGDHELLGLQAAGISPYRLLRVPALWASGWALVSAVALFWGEPWGIAGLRELMARSAQRAVASGMRIGVFNEWIPGVTLYAAARDAEGLRGVFLADQRDPAQPMIISAARGQVQGGSAAQDLILSLRQGVIWMPAGGLPARQRLVHFVSGAYQLDVARLVSHKGRHLSRVQEKGARSLLVEALDPATSASHRALLLITLQRKLSVPLAAVIFSLLAVPLALSRSGAARARGFLISVALVGAYYYLGRALELAARAEQMSPFLAAWAPNLVGVLGLTGLLLRLRRQRV